MIRKAWRCLLTTTTELLAGKCTEEGSSAAREGTVQNFSVGASFSSDNLKSPAEVKPSVTEIAQTTPLNATDSSILGKKLIENSCEAKFKTINDMEEVIEGGPWLFQGQPINLQKWEPGMAMKKLKHTQVPVWIKLHHLPVELWTTEGLSIVASGIGKPLYPDAITRACTRLDFARVCVMLDISSSLPKHIVILTPDDDGGESPCKVDVEYEWVPPKCTGCMSLGHSAKNCVLSKPTKPTKPPVSVYVPRITARGPPKMVREKEGVTQLVADIGEPTIKQKPREEEVRSQSPCSDEPEAPRRDEQRKDKGKDIVLYNTFDALNLLDDDADKHTGGPKPCSPTSVDPYYVTTGNRIWIAWDENFVHVDVIELGAQFIHCNVTIRALHESVALTVIYGANEVADKRDLWTTLGTLAIQCVDTPWLIGGDFNAVRDLSEVCGTSGDIRTGMRSCSFTWSIVVD
ncbi:UNVERIFIED_CONTAM: hypothetical protein Sindi_2930200 [Sesamum indicum]